MIRRELFFPLEEEVTQKINYIVIPSMNIAIYFSILHFIFGFTNLLFSEKQYVGIFDLVFMAIFGLVIVFIKIPILFLLFSILSITGSIIHSNNIALPIFVFSNVVNIICICGTISCLSCSIISIHIFIIISKHINSIYSLRSINILLDEELFLGVSDDDIERNFIIYPHMYGDRVSSRFIPESQRCNSQAIINNGHGQIKSSYDSPFIPFKGPFVRL